MLCECVCVCVSVCACMCVFTLPSRVCSTAQLTHEYLTFCLYKPPGSAVPLICPKAPLIISCLCLAGKLGECSYRARDMRSKPMLHANVLQLG